MSTEKTINGDLSSRLLILVEEHTDGNAALFAQKAGIVQATFHNYIKGRPPNVNSLNNICNNFNVNLNWLITGKGEKYISGNAPTLDEDPEIAELLDGARKVLTSGNPIAFDALERNIRYFAHAVATEKRMEILEAEMDEMKRMVMDLKSTAKCETVIEEEEPTKKKAI